MKSIEFPAGAPFSEQQKAWLSGFAAGLSSQLVNLKEEATSISTADRNHQTIHLLYGSQTGNAEMVAEDACEMAVNLGFRTELKDLNSISMENLEYVKEAIFVVSTHGEGEMPDNAELFWEALSATTAPRLEHLRYGVLGLGDTSYDEFCQAAKMLDIRLEQLGADRITKRLECDVDYEDFAGQWVSESLPLLRNDEIDETVELITKTERDNVTEIRSSSRSRWNKKNPFAAKLADKRLLSGEGSKKEVVHYSLDLDLSDIRYEPGDAINIVPINHSSLVDEILETLAFAPSESVKGYEPDIRELLMSRFEIVTPSKEFINALSQRLCDQELLEILTKGDKESKNDFLWGKDCLDLLKAEMKYGFTADEFVSLLKPLQHRAYSISSSQLAYEKEVHMTIASVRWNGDEREHRGVASTWLADGMTEGQEVATFVTQNKGFRLPEDDVPMIMVGPGTGVAPFRAFLQERQARQAKGGNWLFFGDQHEKCDFLYQNEIRDWHESGFLKNLDLAFSRDQEEKVYVQHRMLERGPEIYEWLQSGAYFYVCGDAERMAPDVEAALVQLIRDELGGNEESAKDYLRGLKAEKRYLRDVY